MRRLMLVLIPLWAVGSLWSEAAPASVPAVFIQSEPMNARIRLDGQMLPSMTPVRLEGLALGHHRLEFWKEGYKDLTVPLNVVPQDAPLSIQVRLKPASLVLAFPESATLWTPQGRVPTLRQQFRFSEGTYTATVDEDGATVLPVDPNTESATMARWSMGLIAGSAFVSTLTDLAPVYHGDAGGPHLLTAALWTGTIAQALWLAELTGRHERFAQEWTVRSTPMSEKFDQAAPLAKSAADQLAKGNLTESEQQLTRLIHDFPDSSEVPLAWFHLAKIHLVTGRRALAQGEYAMLIREYPTVETYADSQKLLDGLKQQAATEGSGTSAEAALTHFASAPQYTENDLHTLDSLAQALTAQGNEIDSSQVRSVLLGARTIFTRETAKTEAQSRLDADAATWNLRTLSDKTRDGWKEMRDVGQGLFLISTAAMIFCASHADTEGLIQYGSGASDPSAAAVGWGIGTIASAGAMFLSLIPAHWGASHL